MKNYAEFIYSFMQDTEDADLKEYEGWIMKQADENKDGELSKEELKALFFG